MNKLEIQNRRGKIIVIIINLLWICQIVSIFQLSQVNFQI